MFSSDWKYLMVKVLTILILTQTAAVVTGLTIGAMLQICSGNVIDNILWDEFLISKILCKNENDNSN